MEQTVAADPFQSVVDRGTNSLQRRMPIPQSCQIVVAADVAHRQLGGFIADSTKRETSIGEDREEIEKTTMTYTGLPGPLHQAVDGKERQLELEDDSDALFFRPGDQLGADLAHQLLELLGAQHVAVFGQLAGAPEGHDGIDLELKRGLLVEISEPVEDLRNLVPVAPRDRCHDRQRNPQTAHQLQSTPGALEGSWEPAPPVVDRRLRAVQADPDAHPVLPEQLRLPGPDEHGIGLDEGLGSHLGDVPDDRKRLLPEQRLPSGQLYQLQPEGNRGIDQTAIVVQPGTLRLRAALRGGIDPAMDTTLIALIGQIEIDRPQGRDRRLDGVLRDRIVS